MVVSQELVYGFKRRVKVARFDYFRCCRHCDKVFVGSRYAKVCFDCYRFDYVRGVNRGF